MRLALLVVLSEIIINMTTKDLAEEWDEISLGVTEKLAFSIEIINVTLGTPLEKEIDHFHADNIFIIIVKKGRVVRSNH